MKEIQKLTIQNRKGQNIVVLLDETENQKGLAFVMHGLGGYKEQPHIELFAKTFKENRCTVVRFDTTNTFGESDGNYEDATVTNYHEDLEDVINWAKTQSFYQEPFYLAGHSLGGISTALYAEKYPEKIKGLAPISTVVSGELSLQTENHKETKDEWKRTGWKEEKSASDPSRVKRLKWNHMEDRLKHDLIRNVDALTMPVLMIVGDQDGSTPVEHQQILYEKIPGENKELHIIKGAPHTFRDEEHLKEIKDIFMFWIKKTI